MRIKRYVALVGTLMTWTALSSPASAQVGSTGGPGASVYAPAASCKPAGGAVSYGMTGTVSGSGGAIIRCPTKHRYGGTFQVYGTKGSGTSTSLASRCSYVSVSAYNGFIQCSLFGDEVHGYVYSAYDMFTDDLQLTTPALTGCYFFGSSTRCPLVRTDATSQPIEVSYFQPSGGSFSTCKVVSSDLYGEEAVSTRTFFLSSGTSSVFASLPTLKEYLFMECALTPGAFVSTFAQH